MRRLILGLAALLVAGPLSAQQLGTPQTITALNGCATYTGGVAQAQTFTFAVSDTFTGTIVLSATVDGANYFTSINGTSLGSIVSSTGLLTFSVTGSVAVRACATAWTSGTATVVARGGPGSASSAGASGSVTISGLLPAFATAPSVLISAADGTALGARSDALKVSIENSQVSSATVTDAATLTAGTASLAQTATENFLFGGTTWAREIQYTALTGGAAPAGSISDGAVDSASLLQADLQCNKSVIGATSSSTTAQIVAVSGSLHPYVCGFIFMSSGTVNVSLVTGTGSNCGSVLSGASSTGLAAGSAAGGAISMIFPLTTQTGSVTQWPTHGWLADAGSANAVCIKTDSTGPVNYWVFYAQK